MLYGQCSFSTSYPSHYTDEKSVTKNIIMMNEMYGTFSIFYSSLKKLEKHDHEK